MNLDKDPAILELLRRLRSQLGPSAFVLADHWEQDLCAVGIASPLNPRVLVYISTYAERPGLYNYELELPPHPGDESLYQVKGRAFDVSFEELAVVVAEHLKQAQPGAGSSPRSVG